MTRVDAVILGAGAAGLSVASGLAQLGLDVVLAEPGPMGGECLNSGCVPSKALLSAAKEIATARRASELGLHVSGTPDFSALRARWQAAIAAIAPHDSQERFEGLGARVLRAPGHFVSAREVKIGEQEYRARHVVLAIGSRPHIPDIPGLGPYLTNETLWQLDRLPPRLTVLGGGAMGCEMAQAFARLGSQVTLVHHRPHLLRGVDAAQSRFLTAALRADGVTVKLTCEVAHVEGGNHLHLSDGSVLEGQTLLLATGRRVDAGGIAPDVIGLEWNERGIAVDASMRTNVPRVWAIGDCATGPRLTHAADAQASVLVRQIAFRLPARFNSAAMPQVVYTDPPVGFVGAQEGAHVLARRFADNDRAVAEHRTEGELTLVLDRKGKIIGARATGTGADEALAWAAILIAAKVSARDLTGATLPYPTRAELARRLAGDHYAPLVFGARARWLVRMLARLVP